MIICKGGGCGVDNCEACKSFWKARLIDIIVELAIFFELDWQAAENDASLEDTYDGWIDYMLEENWDHSLNFFTFICDKDELLYSYGISEEDLPEWLVDNDDTIKQRLKSTLAMKGFW